MALVALAVKLTSSGPILFRQKRMGRFGQTFEILKFRSMNTNGKGPVVTKVGDSRLTPIGAFLRKSKLDELPQLVNVVKGDMSLVGPRPKVPHHQTYTLRVRPGVTGAASLAFRDEERFLHHVPDHALDECQVNMLMPLKREIDDAYMAHSSFVSDIGLIWRTVSGGHKADDRRRVDELQHSLMSLSQALGASVVPQPQQAAVRNQTAELNIAMRNVVAR